MKLESPISALSGVGPKMAEKLAKLGVERILDILFHLPLRYQDRTRITPIAQVKMHQDYVIEGRVVSHNITYGKRRSLIVTIEDDSASVNLRFFHFSKAQQNNFQQGRLMRCFGEARQGPRGAEFIHPEYEFDPDSLESLPDSLTPVYPTTEGITQQLWRKLQEQATKVLASSQEPLSLFDLPERLKQLDVSLKDALMYLHHPPPDTDLHAISEGRHPYQQRLAFEELLAHQLSMLKFRASRQAYTSPALTETTAMQQLIKQLPFSLTGAQAKTVAEIQQDLAKTEPMMRLVQGDVGSGKTVVAAAAAAIAVAQGYQVAIMAPTEILAEQHKENFEQWFEPMGFNVAWLVGRHTPKQKQEIIAGLSSGETQIVLGTHAVFQDNVEFAKLGLIIIDEQHRFGVHQRLALRDKGMSDNEAPHQLIMTATPIPRTLAMTAYADLDLSIINELPPGRTPVKTIVIEQTRREEVIERIRAACLDKRQAYWVCTLIEESETLNCQAAEKTAELLNSALPELTVGLVHGRLKPKEKAEVMSRFSSGEIDLLVATTVIEVGVNVPNASLMVIENPERLGLAQLHQLRGRVGRGSTESFCVLLYQKPLSNHGKERLNIMRQSNDGFEIAETDLKLRGPGEVLGSRQTGVLQFRIADVERDNDLLNDVSEYAHQLFEQKSTIIEPLISRWIYLADYYSQG